MANSVDRDQTAPMGAVCSGSTLFVSILNLSVMLGNYLQQTTSADDFRRRHFQMHFFLVGALRGKYTTELAANQKFIDIALANQKEPSVCVCVCA